MLYQPDTCMLCSTQRLSAKAQDSSGEMLQVSFTLPQKVLCMLVILQHKPCHRQAQAPGKLYCLSQPDPQMGNPFA